MKQLITILLSALILFSCQQEDTLNIDLKIPPVETMVIDFGDLTNNNKSALVVNTNWIFSATSVGVWNLILGTTFAIPVASFKAAFSQQPTKIDDTTWEWTYSVDGFTSNYTARLVGMLEPDVIKWEMYVSKDGVDSFEEFLWFEGTSLHNETSGQWILYHSAEFPEETIQIDWQKEDDEIGEITYTYVRELNDQRETDMFNGSYLTYGLQEVPYDAYVYIHAYNNKKEAFTDTSIEWNRTEFNGHVKAEHYFNDTEWHCWDSEGKDIDCN